MEEGRWKGGHGRKEEDRHQKRTASQEGNDEWKDERGEVSIFIILSSSFFSTFISPAVPPFHLYNFSSALFSFTLLFFLPPRFLISCSPSSCFSDFILPCSSFSSSPSLLPSAPPLSSFFFCFPFQNHLNLFFTYCHNFVILCTTKTHKILTKEN